MKKKISIAAINNWQIALWVLCAITLSNAIDFDWSQDISAYYQNILNYDIYGELIRVDYKSPWYTYLVFPLTGLFGKVEITLSIIKSINVMLFVLAVRKKIQSQTEYAIVIAIILLIPAISENIFEYLRQGTAIGIFLFAISLDRQWARWILITLALFFHFGTGLLLAGSLGGHIITKIFSRRIDGQANGHLALFYLFGITFFILIAGIIFSDLMRNLPGSELFLGGHRTNILAMLYLWGYACYLGFRFIAHRSTAHAVAYAGMLIICVLYTNILDFGRAMSLIVPLHLLAALTLKRRFSRFVDLIVVALGGSMFLLA